MQLRAPFSAVVALVSWSALGCGGSTATEAAVPDASPSVTMPAMGGTASDATDDAGGAIVTSEGDAGGDLGGAALADAGSPDAMSIPPLDASAITPCPTSGDGAFIVSGASCFNFTPAEAGAASTGANATVPNYAIRPSTPTATLVLFFIGTGGTPAGAVRPDPTMNFFGAAVSDGRAVLAISYSNADAIGTVCNTNDACYFPTRRSVIFGDNEPGSAVKVAPDESIVDRTARALRFLAAGDPGGGWQTYLTTLDPSADPSTAIAWPTIITAGHSQGGGHATAVAKLFPVINAVQLSSTCDSPSDVAATWTNGADGTWKTDPTNFWGLGSYDTDTQCPNHLIVWRNLGMVTDHKHDMAEICGETGNTHDASLKCTDNYPAWLTFLK